MRPPQITPLQRLYQLDKAFAEELDKHFNKKKHVDELLQLPKTELVELVNYLHDTVTRLDRIGASPRKCLLILQKICGTLKILPDAHELSGTLSVAGGGPHAHGGSSDVRNGSLRIDVCVKQVRIYANSDRETVKESFCREAVLWKRLRHQNIVLYKSATLDPLQLISEWMPGGELREYIKKHPEVNLLRLLLDVAEGLEYLHSNDIIHGDLKGPNIVVDEGGNARITDFGLASITRDPSSVQSTISDSGYTQRWAAPEVFGGESIASKQSDIFSFGMVILEVFSGEVPFHGRTSQAAAWAVMNGDRPQRPPHLGLTDSMWELAQKCWSHKMDDRPEIQDVIKELRGMKPLPIQPIRDPPPKSNVFGGERVTPYDLDNLPLGQTPRQQGKAPSRIDNSNLPATAGPKVEDKRGQRVDQRREREDKERAEKERMEKERVERERVEKERAERERIEKERADKERVEKDHAERKRMEKERVEKEKERAERERVEKERAERKRVDKERAEKERAERERVEKERVERERLEREREQRERVEKERTERKRMDRERAGRERAEKEPEQRERMEEYAEKKRTGLETGAEDGHEHHPVQTRDRERPGLKHQTSRRYHEHEKQRVVGESAKKIRAPAEEIPRVHPSGSTTTVNIQSDAILTSHPTSSRRDDNRNLSSVLPGSSSRLPAKQPSPPLPPTLVNSEKETASGLPAPVDDRHPGKPASPPHIVKPDPRRTDRPMNRGSERPDIEGGGPILTSELPASTLTTRREPEPLDTHPTTKTRKWFCC